MTKPPTMVPIVDTRSQREIQLRVIFLRIGEIDTLNEKFFAEVLVEAKWEEPKLCVEFDQRPVREEKELSSGCKYWNPKIYIENTLNDPNQAVHYRIKKEVLTSRRTSSECERNNNDYHYEEFNNFQFKYWIYEYRKLKGFFFEKLELHYFPVDIQSMSIVLTSYRSNKEVRFVPNKKRKSIVNNKLNIDNNIWQLFQHVEVLDDSEEIEETEEDVEVYEYEKDVIEKNEKKKKRRDSQFKLNAGKFPMLRFVCKAARRSGYFYWNVFLPIFLITSAAFSVFMVDPEKPQFRLPVTATLMLTSIMFKSSTSTKYLPTVNYLTSLDKYSIFSLVFIYLCIFWYCGAVLLLEVYDPKVVYIIDKTVLVFLILLYIIVHVISYMWLRSAYMIRNSMIDRDEEFWRNENVKDEPKDGDEAGQSFFATNSNPISPSVIQNLESQKASGGGFRRVSLKRESVFGTVNKMDKINYYRNLNRRPSITENFKFFFNIGHKKPDLSKSLSQMNPEI